MSSSGLGSYNDILDAIGYPYLANQTENDTSFSPITYEGQVYITQYREGTFWQAGETLDMTRYMSAFTDIGIYSTYGAEGKSYFTLDGWYIDLNNNGKCDAGEMLEYNEYGKLVYILSSSVVEKGEVLIKAVWSPINIDITFYYDKST